MFPIASRIDSTKTVSSCLSRKPRILADLRFEEKLVCVVGLYLNPPKRAVAFSFDEKTQVRALDRTQPSLPIKRCRAQTMTHDYKRHGTIDLCVQPGQPPMAGTAANGYAPGCPIPTPTAEAHPGR